MNKIKLVIFDFDGTLGDTRRNIVKTMQSVIAELHLPFRDEPDCVATIGLPLAECFRTLFPELAHEVVRQCEDTYRRIFAENLQTLKPQPFPQVPQTLDLLKSRGYALTIASSRFHASLVELMHDMGIAQYISYLIGADDVVKAKPNPEPVLQTLAALHTDAAQALVVGDMAVDILMGARAGTRTCGVTWGNGSRKELTQAGADFVINRMEELSDILQERG